MHGRTSNGQHKIPQKIHGVKDNNRVQNDRRNSVGNDSTQIMRPVIQSTAHGTMLTCGLVT